MNVNNITSYNQSSPAFGNLIIKNKKWFAEKGMNIIKAVKENQDLMRFAKEPQNDVVLAKEWLFGDFSLTIKEKGIKGLGIYRMFVGNYCTLFGKFSESGEDSIRTLKYKNLSTCIQRAKDRIAQKKAQKAAKKQLLKQERAEQSRLNKQSKADNNKRVKEALKEIKELQK